VGDGGAVRGRSRTRGSGVDEFDIPNSATPQVTAKHPPPL
jgi:hypothetical protein